MRLKKITQYALLAMSFSMAQFTVEISTSRANLEEFIPLPEGFRPMSLCIRSDWLPELELLLYLNKEASDLVDGSEGLKDLISKLGPRPLNETCLLRKLVSEREDGYLLSIFSSDRTIKNHVGLYPANSIWGQNTVSQLFDSLPIICSVLSNVIKVSEGIELESIQTIKDVQNFHEEKQKSLEEMRNQYEANLAEIKRLSSVLQDDSAMVSLSEMEEKIALHSLLIQKIEEKRQENLPPKIIENLEKLIKFIKAPKVITFKDSIPLLTMDGGEIAFVKTVIGDNGFVDTLIEAKNYLKNPRTGDSQSSKGDPA